MTQEEIDGVLRRMEEQGFNMYGLRQDPPPELQQPLAGRLSSHVRWALTILL